MILLECRKSPAHLSCIILELNTFCADLLLRLTLILRWFAYLSHLYASSMFVIAVSLNTRWQEMFIKLFPSYFVWVSTRITLQDNKLSLSTKKSHHNLYPHCTFFKENIKNPHVREAQFGLQKCWEINPSCSHAKNSRLTAWNLGTKFRAGARSQQSFKFRCRLRICVLILTSQIQESQH